MIDYRKSLHDATPGLPLVEICPLALLTDPQGNLLLVRDPDDIYWHLMGGWLTPNETIRECLQRSILNMQMRQLRKTEFSTKYELGTTIE